MSLAVRKMDDPITPLTSSRIASSKERLRIRLGCLDPDVSLAAVGELMPICPMGSDALRVIRSYAANVFPRLSEDVSVSSVL